MRCMKFSGSKRASSTGGGRTAGSASKKQPTDPCTTLPPSHTTPLNPPPLTRQQHQLQLQQQRGGANKSHDHAASGAVLASIGPKPSQSESRMSVSGGRHPHPPSGNNSKLKHKCPFDGCPWKFATPYKLRRHIKSHTKETPFLCKECGRGFSVRYNLLMHIQTIHSQPQRFKCPVKGCKEAFHTQPRLNGHLRRVHKKDWKTLQATKAEGSGKQPGSRSSSTSSVESVEATPKAQRLECSQCHSVFPSQAKLNIHMKSHSSDRAFKCSVQGCNKIFPTKDKLTKHLEVHRNPKQFCCPHENCNRVFLRQSHLKNHLKIHTHDYFVCPVMECGQKFVSESEYNVHLNTHINYGHKCQVSGCGLTFTTHKRLELHCRVMHGLEIPGHQGFLPTLLGHSPPLPVPFQHSPPSLHHTCPLRHESISEFEDVFREVDLPGLSADEIEAVLSENSDWSGEQFKNFFHSAVELSEIEAKLFSGSGYESDSGYSTYDVSPITSSAPMQFGCRPAVSTSFRSISPALTPVNPSPFINLSSSNPFQFASTSMHMSAHSTTPCSTPLPHSAPPDAEFAFFPPTPSYQLPLPPPSLMPVHEGYMVPSHPPHTFPPPSSQYQREYPPTTFAPMVPVEARHAQADTFSSEFTDLLCEAPSKECVSEPCHGVQRREQVFPQSFTLHHLDKVRPRVKTEQEETETCSNPASVDASSDLPGTPNTTMSLPASLKFETKTEASEDRSEACKEKQLLTSSSSAQDGPASPTSASSSTPLQRFIATCSKLPALRDLLSSTPNSTVFVVTVSVALSALAKQTESGSCEHKEELSVPKGPYNVCQLESHVAKLTPSQIERLADPKLLAAAKSAATTHVESLAASQDGDKLAVITTDTPNEAQLKQQDKTQTPQLASMLAKNGTVCKCVIPPLPLTLKVVPKSQQKSRVGRIGTGSPMKCSHKKKTQWPRSMSKANLLAFREHILNKLKRGQDDIRGFTVQESSQLPNPSTSSACEVKVTCERNVSMPVRCSSEPADVFNVQSYSESPSPLQTSHSAGDINLCLHVTNGDSEKSPNFNPDILLSSSVLGLPDNLLDDMDTENLGALSSGSVDDLTQLLGDSPPSSVTSLMESMELNCLQDFLSGSSGNSTASSDFSSHFTESSSSIATSVHNSFPSNSTHSFPNCHQTASCSMPDVFNESISSIANVEAMQDTSTSLNLEDHLDSIFQRATDPLLACSSRLHW